MPLQELAERRLVVRAQRDEVDELGIDESRIEVEGSVVHGEFRVLRVHAATIPNALAALLLDLRDKSGVRPHMYFEWTEGSPIAQMARFLLFGTGEVAPLTREVVRRAEKDPKKRPHVHAG